MPSLLLVGNPARRKARRKSTKAPSAAQRRARAKFAAAARARSHKSRRRTTTTLRSNPVKHRRVRRASAHAAVRHHRRARRNPIKSASLRNISHLLKSSAASAAGALGVDVLMGFAQSYLPAAIATPNDASGGINYGYYAAKGALAVGAGMALTKVIGANKAAHVTEGSLIVTLHGLMARIVAANVSSVPLGMYPQKSLGFMPGGRVMPAMASQRSLRGIGMYSGSGSSALAPVMSQREQTLR